MKIVSNVTDKVLSTKFSEFAEEKTFILEYNISYIANWYFCSDYMSIASNATESFQIVLTKKKLRIVQYVNYINYVSISSWYQIGQIGIKLGTKHVTY